MAGERILMVEDEPLIAHMLRDCLAPLYVEVVHVTTGPEALEVALSHPPDLILLDVMIPGIDGFEVARQIKSDPRTSHLPIIFLTALAQVKDKVRGFQLGADDYITKPFHPDEVQARITGALQRAEAVRAQRAAEGARGTRGRLRDMSLPNLMQFIELERASGVLSLTHAAEQGHIYFDRGRVVNAAMGAAHGEEAVYRLLDWDDGDFDFERLPDGSGPEAVVTASNHALLLEGMRRKDERQRLQGQLPPLSSRLQVGARLQQVLQGKRPAPDLQRYMDLLDGTRTLQQVIDESGRDEITAMKDLTKLYERGLLEPRGTS